MKRLHRSGSRSIASTLPPTSLPAIEFARVMEAAPVFAVISDIHGNLEALQGVLAFLDARNISTVICLGDIVGYGPNPCECITVIRERGIPSLRGNHDAHAVAARIPSNLSTAAVIGLRHTRRCLADADRDFLRKLPMEILLPQMAFVHASYPRPGAWNYVVNGDEALPHLLTQPTPLSFFGHSHWPGGFVSGLHRIVPLAPAPEVHFNWEDRACFNPGAVGQPRDHDPRASLIVCRPSQGLIEFHRVAYDMDRATDAIARAGLPERFAERLKKGQ